jgi:hypothetical protein
MANLNKLRNTVVLMLSDDWKDRFVAEYRQLDERIKGLSIMLEAWDKLSFTPNCSKELLESQLAYMKKYKHVLDVRADIEEINLEI